MKLQNIFTITLLAFFSCKGGNNDLHKKEASIIKEQSSTLVKAEEIDKNIEKFKFNTVSQNPIVDVKKESRAEIINRFKETDILINLKEKTFQAGKECTFEYFEKKVTPIKYWYSQSTVNIYKEELAKIGISLPAEFSVFISSNPNKGCEYPTSEYILIDGKIIFIYDGYLIAFENTKLISKNTFSFSTLKLPYNKKIDYKNAKYERLSTKSISGLSEFACNEEQIRYISLEKTAKINLIIVPMDCGDSPYRYYLLSVFNNKVISSLYVEGELYEPEANNNPEITNFSIDKESKLTVKTINKDFQGNSVEKKYLINDQGKIVENI
ncbi:hypothetical protein [Chryseobacterium sp.]|uniref:hypothetical protein n=1 Tax=Chryseobacterium sp. TaxID=1871047 RepID=UPI0025BF3C70|nr:hypothetical protein [Chryseobacterium sp.]MBV8326121.1 hypothetical protein [Chryseobacterium sp.]